VLKLKFNRSIVFRVVVREDKVLPRFIKLLKDLKVLNIEVDEEYRRVYFKIQAMKYLGLKDIIDEYAKSAYYEVKSLSNRVRIPEDQLRRTYEIMKNKLQKIDRVTVHNKITIFFVDNTMNGYVYGEAPYENSLITFNLRSIHTIGGLDSILITSIPPSLYTFSYNSKTYITNVERSLKALYEVEDKLRKTLNTS